MLEGLQDIPTCRLFTMVVAYTAHTGEHTWLPREESLDMVSPSIKNCKSGTLHLNIWLMSPLCMQRRKPAGKARGSNVRDQKEGRTPGSACKRAASRIQRPNHFGRLGSIVSHDSRCGFAFLRHRPVKGVVHPNSLSYAGT